MNSFVTPAARSRCAISRPPWTVCGSDAPVAEPRVEAADARELDIAVARLREAERPVIMAGTNLYWGRA